tara:strand:+ start:650 stop:967 length:318 start_codon:yes stop_codon:yes gene_type:complete
MDLKKYTLLYALFSFLFSFGVFAQTISGVVESEEGPLPGATIIEVGTGNGTTTDFDGNFILKLENNEASLEISYIGFLSQVVNVSDTDNIQISLLNQIHHLMKLL